MPEPRFANYEEASQEYLRQFQAVLEAPRTEGAGTARGSSGIQTDFLIKRADSIADVSKQVTDLSRSHLESSDLDRRESVSMQLVSQAAAELNLAVTLIESAASQEEGPAMQTRAASQQLSVLSDAVKRLTQAMQTPTHALRRGAVPATPSADPAANLQKTVKRTVGVIVDQVIEVGGDIALDLIDKTEWNAVLSGVALLNKNVGELIQKIADGVGKLLRLAMAVVQKLILNVYDKILALFGKGVEDEARQQVQQWLEKLKQERNSLSKEVLSFFYRVNAFEKALEDWLPSTQASPSDTDRTAGQIDDLAARFQVFAGHVADVETALTLAKLAGKFFPQLLPIVAGIQGTLLTALVYSGFDYVGYKQPLVIDIVRGTAQVIHENLGFPI